MRNNDLEFSSKLAIWVIPACVLFIDPNRSDPINLPKLLILTSFTIGAIAMKLFGMLALRSFRFSRPNKVQTMYLIFLLFLTIASIASTPNIVRLSMGSVGRNNGLLYYLSVVILVLFVLSTRNSLSYQKFILKWLSVTSLFFLGYSALQYLNLDPIPWTNEYNRIVGTLGNPNFSASILGVFSVYWFYLALEAKKGKKSTNRIALIAFSLLSAILALATESLQGPLIVITGLIVIFALRLNRSIRTKQLRSALFGGLLILATTTLFSFLGLGPFGDRMGQYTLILRTKYMQFGLKAMMDNPLVGVGVDSYAMAFKLNRDADFVQQYGVDLYTDNAHSTPIQIGACFGIAVFLLYCCIQLVLLKCAISTLLKIGDDLIEMKAIALVWILVFAQSLLSIENIGLGILNWILGAVLLGSKESLLPPVTSHKKKLATLTEVKEPEWLGAATFITLCLSLVPYWFVSQADSTWKILSRIDIRQESDARFVREKVRTLSPLTRYEPIKVSMIASKLIESKMSLELTNLLNQLVLVNPKDPIAIELLAIHLHNQNMFEDELKLRIILRALDPMNYRLELQVAELYDRLGKKYELQQSIQRIKEIAPPESPEWKRANELSNK